MEILIIVHVHRLLGIMKDVCIIWSLFGRSLQKTDGIHIGFWNIRIGIRPNRRLIRLCLASMNGRYGMQMCFFCLLSLICVESRICRWQSGIWIRFVNGLIWTPIAEHRHMRLSLMIWSVSVPSSSLWKGNVFTIFAVGDCWKSVCRLVMKFGINN